MVGAPERRRRLVDEVAALYDWLDAELGRNADRAGRCTACGKCCDFAGYDHRLFVTAPELIYLATRLETTGLRDMVAGRCPYQDGTRCTVHAHRFASCRIFCCHGDPDLQSELSEQAVARLRDLCERFDVPYSYTELSEALARFNADTCRSAGGPCPAGPGG